MKRNSGILCRVGLAVRRFAPKYLYALITVPFLFTAGIFSRRHRFLIFQIAKHFGMKMPTGDRRIPVIPISQVLDSHLELTLLELIAEGGNVSLLELMAISSIIRHTKPSLAFEIGTFDGRTTLNIAANLPPQGKVYTLDLPKTNLRRTKFELAPGESAFVDKEESGGKFINTEFATRIEQLYGDSATFDFSPYKRQMGFVFVDGSHAFEYVLQDSDTAIDLITRREAIVLWHDYQEDWLGVIEALNQLYENDSRFFALRRIEGTSLVMLKNEYARRST
jgi:hypothetical protein